MNNNTNSSSFFSSLFYPHFDGFFITFLQLIVFVFFKLFINKETTFSSIKECRHISNDYKDKFITYNIARNALNDANIRYDRIHSKLFFTAQLQGIILMGLALSSSISNCSTKSNYLYSTALILEIISILFTCYSLAIKKDLTFVYELFSDHAWLTNIEQEEFNKIIPFIHDRCDFLANMYHIILLFFLTSLLTTFLYLKCPNIEDNFFSLFIYIVLFRLFYVQKSLSSDKEKQIEEINQLTEDGKITD